MGFIQVDFHLHVTVHRKIIYFVTKQLSLNMLFIFRVWSCKYWPVKKLIIEVKKFGSILLNGLEKWEKYKALIF